MASTTHAAESSGAAALESAYARCEQLAREHYENFPVVSRLLSRDARRALAAVYAFARAADDIADESASGKDGPSSDERLAALGEWEERLRSCTAVPAPAAAAVPAGSAAAPAHGGSAHAAGASSRPSEAPLPERQRSEVATEGSAWRPDPADADATFLALGDVIRRHALDLAPFLDLLSAFRQDVHIARYETRAALLDYCRRSADPVGRIVLAVHGVRDERRVQLSDRICTALQLANFWQDIAVDRAKDRIYLPLEDLRRHGVEESDLDAPAASARLRALVLEEAAWARSLFEEGRGLLEDAPTGLGLHLRLVWHGGTRILELIEAAAGDVLAERPKLGRLDAARVLVRALARSERAGGRAVEEKQAAS